MPRPVLRVGSFGPDVTMVQVCLDLDDADGDFGPATEAAVAEYQRGNSLDADGVVGPSTWDCMELEFPLPPYPPPLLPSLDQSVVDAICELADTSSIADYQWRDRGKAPVGYTRGMAMAWATMYRKWIAGDTTAVQCAIADRDADGTDALSWYSEQFDDLGMINDEDGVDTLRHLFVLLMGLGMRESSGKHCEGRDMSAENVSSDTCEAGLFQQSWNSRSCNTEIEKLLDEYEGTDDAQQGAGAIFEQGVECSSSSWSSYGSGDGRQFQDQCKHVPQFAVECAAVGLRFLRQHWGPVNRYEVELKSAADDLFLDIQQVIDSLGPIIPVPPDTEIATVNIKVEGPVVVSVNGVVVYAATA